jgi:hypothetical protein
MPLAEETRHRDDHQEEPCRNRCGPPGSRG